ncbi:wd40 repeat [Echinococcus multilocularis]|uniref:Wd40 repeat n=1 Tax=Echinococcus multilocularis TaxID=6211 RepID=A0A068YHE5_ECHMU|nr:wd40 repeat [Echinococcus multilocularis]
MPKSKPKCYESPIVEEDDFGVHTLRFNADGRQLIAGSANTSVRVINVIDGQQQLLLRPSTWKLGMPITCLRYVPTDLQWVLGCTPQGDIFCLDSNQEGFETLITEENQETYCLDISPDGMELATAGKDTAIRLYSLHVGQQTGFETQSADFVTLDEHRPKPRKMCSEGERFANPLKNDLEARLKRCKRFAGGKGEQAIDHYIKPFIVPINYRRDSEQNVCSDKANSSTAEPHILGYHPTGPADNYTEGHSMRIAALRYHPTQPRLLASASWDHHVKVWDTRTREGPVHDIYGPLVCSPEGLDIEGDHILTASWRKCQALEIWDLRNLHPIEEPAKVSNLASGDVENTLWKQAYMRPAECIDVVEPVKGQSRDGGGGEYLYAARLLPSRAIVCGGSGFNEVRVVHRDTKLPIIRIPTDSVVQTIDSVLEGRFIAIGCASGSITIAGLA